MSKEALKELIFRLAQAAGVSGDEAEAVEAARAELAQYGKTRTDALGNLIGEIAPFKEGRPHILLDAHIDEVGLIVTGICDGGFLRVDNAAGVDTRILSTADVTVHAKEKLFGVISAKPPHLSDAKEYKKAVKLTDTYVDTGLSREECERLVTLGDRITLNGVPRETASGRIISKALDNRICCAAILRCLELLQDKALDCGLTVLFSTREESGGQGARAAAFGVDPTHAIVVDTTLADGVYESGCHYEIGKGPTIGYAPILDRKMSQDLVALAEENNIPYAIEAMGRGTGTNADDIVTTREGVITGVISIPERYAHMPIEMADLGDVEYAARLMAAYVEKIASRT